MSTVIKVENLSKQYRLGLVGASTFKEDSQRWWAKMRGKQDPFLNQGVENDRTINDDSKYVWSLKDINFDVKKGDVLGVIGRNGAGKSTLLKILSKVTAPTTGTVKVKGRIASLLEVGTGFHPELTGKENIYLNGAILGMRKHEITRKLDEIVEFAGVEKYIDTPVKRYSSGMYVRLAFAVAAHLESEILIVDEVLAVGDAEFQKKCLGKMGEVSKGEGRTILFVSHNLESVKSLCTSGILLNNGKIEKYSDVNNVLNHYNKFNYDYKCKYLFQIDKSDESKVIEFQSINLVFDTNEKVFNINDNICINITYKVRKSISNSVVNFILKYKNTDLLWSFDTDIKEELLEKRDEGNYFVEIIVPKSILKVGYYSLSFHAGTIGGEFFDIVDEGISFFINEGNENCYNKSYSENRGGIIALPLFWNTIKN